MASQTADQEFVRRINTSIVLDCIRNFAPLSRAEISARTGLNRSTISSIVGDLIAAGFVVETELEESRIGRPGLLLTLNPLGGCVVSLDIGVDFLSVLLTDFAVRELFRKKIPSSPDENQFFILESAQHLTGEALSLGKTMGLRPIGIGVGVPGLVDAIEGKLVFAPNLKWRNAPIRLIFQQRFHLLVFIENEANSAALGEYRFGVAKGISNFIYLSASIGLGGGIMVGGELYRGASGFAGEIGHMTIDPEGNLCGCGKRGCWETYVSPQAVLRRVRELLPEASSGKLRERLREGSIPLTFDEVVLAGSAGDPTALRVMQEAGKNLAIGVGNLINIFDPELVVLGGALNLASTFLIPIIESELKPFVLEPPAQSVRIVSSAHGADACLMGGIARVLDDFFSASFLQK